MQTLTSYLPCFPKTKESLKEIKSELLTERDSEELPNIELLVRIESELLAEKTF